MRASTDQRTPRNRVQRLGVITSVLAGAFALAVAGTAVAGDPEVKPRAKSAPHLMAAADPAGWVVFPSYRSGPAEDFAPAAVKLSRITHPDASRTTALDYLDRWGNARARMSR